MTQKQRMHLIFISSGIAMIMFIFLMVILHWTHYEVPLEERTLYSPHYIKWGELAIRWLHIITGIAWIGSSFYFNWLEGNLNRLGNLPADLEGDLWAVHGGGFYHVEKFKSVPPSGVPDHLHWFKYEAYFTWISGFALLAVVYYLGARTYLIDPEVADISPQLAISIGIGTLILSWFVYDLLCKSPLIQKAKLFAIVSFLLVVAVSIGLSQVFSSRGAYIHVGAMIGTLMVGNVFRVIIPFQKIMVNKASKGETVDPSIGKKAFYRSLHNNYMTLPVLFIMISNHYPMTYGSKHNWFILAGITLSGVAIRHWFNLKNKGKYNTWLWPVAMLMLISLAMVTSPEHPPKIKNKNNKVEKVSFSEVRTIIQKRCTSCHSTNPTDKEYPQPPNGVTFDTAMQIKAKANLIYIQAVQSKVMPLVNRTEMTSAERATLRRWFFSGADIGE